MTGEIPRKRDGLRTEAHGPSVSPSSSWNSQVGLIEDFTREGEVIVSLEEGLRVFHPQEIDDAVRWHPAGLK